MGWLFRRSRGRHVLGAAVTSIPTALPPVSVLPPVPVDAGPPEPLSTRPAPVLPVPAQVLPIGLPAQPIELPLDELFVHQPVWGVPAEPAIPAGPRVQLGFRDGSSTSLDPASSQAQALEELAQSLTRRA